MLLHQYTMNEYKPLQQLLVAKHHKNHVFVDHVLDDLENDKNAELDD